jgi:hypothetical protein
VIRKAAALACLLLVTACGGGTTSSDTDATAPGSDMRTMTEDEAAQRAEEHIRGAVEALPVKPVLTLLRADSAECLDPTDGGPRGRYEVSRSYWLDDLPEERNAEFVDALYEYWTANDYRDAFRMSVKQSVEGDLSLGASSPCVWPDGTPPDHAQQ